MVKIGVLALQGAVREHIQAIEAVGAEAVAIKKVEQLQDIDGLILPGGESTTMRRLIDKYGFFEPLKKFGESGKPIWGTCAGLILMATKIAGQEDAHLGLIDMTVERNAFGRQVDSFEASLTITDIADDFIGVFIRAPRILEVGNDVEIICKHHDKIVAVRQGHYLACSFHPELTDDHRMAQYFVKMVKEAKEKLAV
ncbi:pyridoxal 5'-phosphate synthase glutaminase subunit PdxT [Calidifontibacillus erzurumensis]|uniref:Pyridoxal 5'-phosphate synthase subunit PdxT n=1 Tax=Calidifontibacillus erzurumensis TaxID=2741433 RepID=A0A8J8K8U1_9BACI|nr:pyridoxal 5'-phosphate synthase glutaminase subunit PdxT [Calidifontibacillus erzurumensis]NSL52341.1 pyridoxal 5'-phosphate synthase glutaminase subunit PdxT [Calidifontibacillus erzurumensis]